MNDGLNQHVSVKRIDSASLALTNVLLLPLPGKACPNGWDSKD
jgi:hypothetical protein